MEFERSIAATKRIRPTQRGYSNTLTANPELEICGAKTGTVAVVKYQSRIPMTVALSRHRSSRIATRPKARALCFSRDSSHRLRSAQAA